MAIEFARSERISRGKGGNAVRSAAYAMREKLFDERTGETHKFKNDGTLEHNGILLPDGVDPKFLDAGRLFNAIEGAEKRKDAQVARVIVIALDPTLSRDERVEQANGFARQMFVDKGFPVLVCIHSSRDGRNPHAHLIGGTRRLGPGGFEAAKLQETPFARAFGRPIVLAAERVGALWRDFQNSWFSAHGKGITVDPVAAVPGVHIGPIRFRHPRDQRVIDAKAIRDLKRAAFEKDAWSDKVASGWRKLTIEDIAREMNPAYAAAMKKAEEARKAIEKADKVLRSHAGYKEAAEHRISERWSEIGLLRRGGHVLGKIPALAAFRDVELERWNNEGGRATYTVEKWSIKRTAAAAALNMASRLAEREFEAIRPRAEAELQRRQKIALDARNALDKMGSENKLTARKRRSRHRSQTL